MIIKFKSIIVIIIIFLSVLIVGQNFDLRAKSLGNEMNSFSTFRSKNRLSDHNFDWGQIEVITEPNPNQNHTEIKEQLNIDAPWPMFRHDLNHTGLSPYDTTANPGALIWTFMTGDNIDWSSPVIDSVGTIYIGSYDNNLYAIYPNGTLKWSFKTGDGVQSSPAIGSDGTIYVSSSDNNLYAIYPNGTEKWSFKTGSIMISSPAISADGTIYVGSYDFNLYAIYPNGTLKWSFKTGRVFSSPAISFNGTIYVGSCDNNLYAIYPNGTLKWSFKTGNYIYSSPAIGSDGTIYFGSNDNNLYAIYPNGTEKWTFPTGSDVRSSPAINSDGTIYVGSYDSYLYAIYPNGTEKWSFKTSDCIYSSPAIGSEGTIYIGSDDNNLYAIYPNGTKKWSFKTDNYHSSPAIGSDGKIYIGSGDSKLYAIGIPPILSSGIVTPLSGYTYTYFNYTVNYLDKSYNTLPVYVSVYFDGIEYSMLEVDSTDTNCIDGKDYFFNTTLDISTDHTFQFFTSQYGYFVVSTNITNAPDVFNTPPIITTFNNRTAYEDTYYEITYEYEDLDRENVGQIGTWNYSTNASWLYFDPATAILSGTPLNDDVGEYWVNISINDTMDIDFTNFTLIVQNVNDDPMINTSNVEITYEDELYEVDYNATDVDSLIENQVWSLATNATSWLIVDSITGILNGTPTNDEVGDYWVNVSVADGDGGNGFINFTLSVLNVNDPPIITTEDLLIVQVGNSYSVDYNATDIDSPLSKQTWYLETNASWFRISSRTGIITGSPTIADLGWYSVNVSVDDNDGGQDWHEFKLTVIRENKPPIITTIDVVSVTVNVVYWVDYDAIDDYTPFDKLLWVFKSNASWLNINPNTGVLTGLPKLSDAGQYWINISVSDGENGLDFHNFTLNVYSTPNQPPTIITEDKLTAIVNITYSVDYEAIDDRTSSDYLQWSLNTNSGDWLTIDTNTGWLNGIPSESDVGQYWVNISINDGEGGSDYHNFTLTVESIEDGISKEETFWYWLIWVIIIVIILISLIVLFVYKRRKAKKIPTVRAEILHAPPAHLLPGVTPGIKVAESLPSHPIVSEQLPTQKVHAPSLAPSPVKPLLQLPQATLSKNQKLNLLQERFLRGEVTEETYNKLRAEIEGSTGEEVVKEEFEEEQPSPMEQSQQEPIEEPAKPEAPTSSVPPAPIVETPRELPKIPEVITPQPSIEPKLAVQIQTEQQSQEIKKSEEDNSQSEIKMDKEDQEES